ARECESIAAPAQGFDGTERVLRIELAPEAADQYLDHVAVALRLLVLQPLAALGLGDDRPRAQHEVLEDAVLEGRQLHRCVIHLHGLGARVQSDCAAYELRAGPATGATQQRLYARQHFLEVEWLGYIVVGAGLQALHFVLPAVPRGQDQNGIALALRAHPPDELQSRKLRQAEIHDRDIERQLDAGEKAFLAVPCRIHGEARLDEARLQRFAQR